MSKQVVFFGFTDNKHQETTICKDLGEANKLFDEALITAKYKYFDITLDDLENHTATVVRKWSTRRRGTIHNG